jgi:hypothetical protein
MMMGKLAAAFSLIPTTMALTLSFFVLVVLRKIEERTLKVFGYVIAALLWLCALLLFSSGIYFAAKGKCPMICGIHRAMMGSGMMSGMMHSKQDKPQHPPMHKGAE